MEQSELKKVSGSYKSYMWVLSRQHPGIHVINYVSPFLFCCACINKLQLHLSNTYTSMNQKRSSLFEPCCNTMHYTQYTVCMSGGISIKRDLSHIHTYTHTHTHTHRSTCTRHLTTSRGTTAVWVNPQLKTPPKPQ